MTNHLVQTVAGAPSEWRKRIPALAAVVLVFFTHIAVLAHITSGLRAFTSVESARLQAGALPRPAPDISLYDQNGTELQIAEFKGRTVLVSFVFVGCTRVCLMTNARFKELQEMLKAGGAGADTMLLSVSVDIERDTPARLRQTAEFYAADAKLWRFAVPRSEADLRALRGAFGLWMRKRASGEIDHDSLIAVIDERGAVRRILSGNEPALEILSAAREARHATS